MVVGDKKKNTLLAIKRVTLQRKTRAKLEFAAPDEVGPVSRLEAWHTPSRANRAFFFFFGKGGMYATLLLLFPHV